MQILMLFLQTCHQNLFDVFFGQSRISILKSLIHSDMMRHFVEAAVVYSHFAQVHRNTDRLKERVCRLNRLVRNRPFVQRSVNTEHIHAVLHKPRQRALVQDMLHPPRRNDRQPLSGRNVVIGTQSVLDAVTRPSALAVSECQNAVTAIRTSEHHLRTRLVILRVLNTLAAVLHE